MVARRVLAAPSSARFTSLLLACVTMWVLAPRLAEAQTRQKVALLPFSGSNVHPGYLDAGRDVLKDHLLGTGRFDVVTIPGASGTAELAGPDAVARAREVGAELALVAHLSRLGGSGRVRLIAYRVSDGSLAHADSVGIAGGPDDLDPALQRLAAGLATGKRVEDTAAIDSVTQRDADPYLKQAATKTFGLKLSMLHVLNRPGGQDAAVFSGVGIFWMYDARKFLADVAMDVLFQQQGDSVFQVGIGGYYPFTRGDFSPYAGLSAAFSGGSFGGDGAAGLRVAPVFGVLLGRLSTVQFRGQIGYFINAYQESPKSLTVTAANGATVGKGSYAHGPQLTIALGF